jgi:hypothetical protein
VHYIKIAVVTVYQDNVVFDLFADAGTTHLVVDMELHFFQLQMK